MSEESERELRPVPYYTTDDESQLCGHVWKQRREIGGPWGYMFEVLPPYSDGSNAVARGWRATQEAAEKAMHELLGRHVVEESDVE